MAYAALVSTVQKIEPFLLLDQNPTVDQDRKLMKSLHENLSFLQSFLESSPDNDLNLEERIREVAYQIEDIVDPFMSEQLRSYHNSSQVIGHGDAHSHLFHSLGKLCQELQEITHELDSIVIAIKNGLRNKVRVPLSDDSCVSPRFRSNDKYEMEGFDDELMALKDRICRESVKLQVLSISGMGGIGKTTLARNVYSDSLIVERFDRCAWVTLSQNYKIRDVFRSLLASVTRLSTNFEDKSDGEVFLDVYKYLKGRRYFVVLDDVWTTKVWDELRKVFPDDGNGSTIILTTRLADVAVYADPSIPVHEMHPMGMEESWNLLRERVFPGSKNCPSQLESIGRMIARRCRGLPLAIVVVAGLLSSVSQTEESWWGVANDLSGMGVAIDDRLENILSLSYTHLPHHLRPCFLYIGGFPEDYKIRASNLTKLWVAEGFLKPTSGSVKAPEEQAKEYLEDLVRRNLVLVTAKKYDNKTKTCSIHDLLRDMCIKKAKEEKFLLYVTGNESHQSTRNQRRISFGHSKIGLSADAYGSPVHTILYFYNDVEFQYCLKGFRELKVLNVLEVKLWKFPCQVLGLLQLKFLALTLEYHCLDCLPEDIGRLWKLQTLIVQPRLVLPVTIWGMMQLRHIVSKEIILSFPPTLENLQALSKVKDLCVSETLSHSFRNLKKLGLFYDKDGLEWSSCSLVNLVHFKHLQNLKISAGYSILLAKPFTGHLGFPATLRKLSLSGCGFAWEDMGIVGSLRQLEAFKLRNHACVGSEWETKEGGFPVLKALVITNTYLKHWITESSHFPRLERLVLYECWELSEIPWGIGEIPTLELIQVDDLNKSVTGSAKAIQEEQESMGNDALQVSVNRPWWKA